MKFLTWRASAFLSICQNFTVLSWLYVINSLLLLCDQSNPFMAETCAKTVSVGAESLRVSHKLNLSPLEVAKMWDWMRFQRTWKFGWGRKFRWSFDGLVRRVLWSVGGFRIYCNLGQLSEHYFQFLFIFIQKSNQHVYIKENRKKTSEK